MQNGPCLFGSRLVGSLAVLFGSLDVVVGGSGLIFRVGWAEGVRKITMGGNDMGIGSQ